jgi:hypothetical protein
VHVNVTSIGKAGREREVHSVSALDSVPLKRHVDLEDR